MALSSKFKRAARAVIVVIFTFATFGTALGFVYLFASLGMTPVYVTRVIPAAGIAFISALAATYSGLLGNRQLKIVWSAFLCVCLGCGVYIGFGVYRESLATVDDRGLLLYKYEPFSEGSLVAELDEPSELQFDFVTANSLRLDGATALYPVYSAFVRAVYPEYDYSHQVIDCSNTVHAYERLIKGDADIIFAAGPSEQQLKMAGEAGVELHLTPIGREAFVFFVNGKNPVDGLTVEQIQKIYTGELTNWKQVGGKNQRIRPFQRDENSGSQTALQKLMQGLPLIEPEEEDRIAGMGGMIRQVAAYRNYKNALGFSFRYYATVMEDNDEIKLLALNGVAPTKETIRDGSYPIASEFYAVTASEKGRPSPLESGLQSDADVKAFIEWILGQQGQQLIEKTGYVALNG